VRRLPFMIAWSNPWWASASASAQHTNLTVGSGQSSSALFWDSAYAIFSECINT
jgi:hypothetical protein